MLPVVFLLLVGVPVASADDSSANPLGKTIELLAELKAKIVKDAEAEAKAFKEYYNWCDDTCRDTGFAIKSASDTKEKLEAKIEELSAEISSGTAKIDDLAAAISATTADLKNATGIRQKEKAEFEANEGEMVEAVDTMARAISILEKEMSKNPAAFAQIDTSNLASMLQALNAVMDAASISGSDKKRLVALVQSRDDTQDEINELGAPAGATYKSHSGSIVEVLEDMKDKAEEELSELRKAEATSKHNFDMLKQSLEDQIAADTKNMEDEKSSRSANEESKAADEGELEVTTKALKTAQKALVDTKAACVQTASDHENTVKSREEEFKVIEQATKILKETTSGAEERTYSFIQRASVTSGLRLQSTADLAKSEVITMVRTLAREHHSAALAQLASRISAVIKLGNAGGDDPFSKIKGLISDLISRLEKEAQEEAAEKAYCDEQMSKTEAKKAELEDGIKKLTTTIDQEVAKSNSLKEDVKELQAELATLTKEQAEMDKIREEEHTNFVAAKKDLELGLEGVRKALTVLREYYGAGSSFTQMEQPAMPDKHTKSGGAAEGIISILEVTESDFASNLAKEETQEADSADQYEKTTQENKLEKTTKEKDAKYKTAEYESLDKRTAEKVSDRDGLNNELSAVLEYYAKVKERCIAKPETYEERKKRREAEIAGLKEALNVLENETVFIQRARKVRSMRGTKLSM